MTFFFFFWRLTKTYHYFVTLLINSKTDRRFNWYFDCMLVALEINYNWGSLIFLHCVPLTFNLVPQSTSKLCLDHKNHHILPNPQKSYFPQKSMLFISTSLNPSRNDKAKTCNILQYSIFLINLVFKYMRKLPERCKKYFLKGIFNFSPFIFKIFLLYFVY